LTKCITRFTWAAIFPQLKAQCLTVINWPNNTVYPSTGYPLFASGVDGNASKPLAAALFDYWTEEDDAVPEEDQLELVKWKGTPF
jgi:hypothetical protein